MDFDFYDWSANLFAYLYQHYEDTELVGELPCRMRYTVSETFHQRIGTCQVRVNSILREDLQSVFVKNYLVVCRCISTFRAYTERACLKLSRNFEPQISFLSFCAVISELNLYCFQRGCYRYALYVPECLKSVLQRCDYVALSITDRPEGSSTADGFQKLLECCKNILEHSTATPSSKRKEIVRFGKMFARGELRRFKRMNRLFDLPMGNVQEEKYSSEEEESENESLSEESLGYETKCDFSSPEDNTFAQEDHDANLLAASKIFNPNSCRICHEENCKSYLEEFVRQFSSGKMKYAPLTTQ